MDLPGCQIVCMSSATFLEIKIFSSSPMHVDMNEYAIIYKTLMYECNNQSICNLNGIKLYTEYRWN